MPARGALGTEVGGPRPGQRIRGSRQLARCCSWDSSAPTFTRGPDRRRGRAEQVSHAARSWAPSLRGAGPPRCAELGPLAARSWAPSPDARTRWRLAAFEVPQAQTPMPVPGRGACAGRATCRGAMVLGSALRSPWGRARRPKETPACRILWLRAPVEGVRSPPPQSATHAGPRARADGIREQSRGYAQTPVHWRQVNLARATRASLALTPLDADPTNLDPGGSRYPPSGALPGWAASPRLNWSSEGSARPATR
jgi:hypothetical protein